MSCNEVTGASTALTTHWHFLCHQGTKRALAPPLDLRETKLRNADRRKPLAITASAAGRLGEDDHQGKTDTGDDGDSNAALEVVEGVKSEFFAEPPPPSAKTATRRTARSGASTRRRVRFDTTSRQASREHPVSTNSHASFLER